MRLVFNTLFFTLLLIGLTNNSFSQSKKRIKASKGLPANVLITFQQFQADQNCEVCAAEETLSNGEKIYYQFDRITNKKIQPEGTIDVTARNKYKVTKETVLPRTEHAYKYPNGEILVIHTPKINGKVTRPYKTILLPKGFSAESKLPPSWSFYNKSITVYPKTVGDTTYYRIFNNEEGKEISGHSDWIIANNSDYYKGSIFIRKMENDFYQILKPDMTISPKDTTDELLGYIKIKNSLLFIEAVSINNEKKYYLNQIDNYAEPIPGMKKSSVNKKNIMRIRRINKIPADDFFLVEKGYGSNVILHIDSTYKVYGLPECQLYSSIEAKDCGTNYDYNENTFWFEEPELSLALEVMAMKYEVIKKANDAHWKYIDLRNAQSAEQLRIYEENKKKDIEYNNALKDYQDCIAKKHHYSSCQIGSWTDVLSEQIMLQIANNRKQQIKDKKASDASWQETFRKRNNTIHITDEMKKKGYRVVKWDGKQWK